MTAAVRVIGRIDLAQKLQAALSAAGIEARLHTSGPFSAAAAPPTDGSELDLLVVSSVFDVVTCNVMKLNRAARPVILAAGRRHEARLRRVTGRGLGPDAWVALPADAAEILNAIERATAPQVDRGWARRLDAALLVGYPVLLIAAQFGVVGAPIMALAGALLLTQAPRAWYRAANAIAGALLLVAGVGTTVAGVAGAIAG